MTEYVKDEELENAATDMLGRLDYTEFNPIREHEVKIEYCMKIRQNKDGENEPCKGDPTTLKKVGQVERLFCDADYILIVDNSAWQSCNSTVQQEAIIHRGLMKINIDTSEKGIKVTTRKPDIVEFTATVMRFGAYNDPLLNFREAFSLAAKRVAEELQPENV